MKENQEHYLQLLDKFDLERPTTKRVATYLELTGYSHHENIWSNLLSFYLNPSENHPFGDRIFRCLLRTIGEDENELTSPNFIYREYPTLTGNRIDILLVLDEGVIIIENKVYADLHNDLDDYYQFIETNFNLPTYIVVLSLNPITLPTDKQHFIAVTYKDFIYEIEKELKLDDPKNLDEVHFYDFINTIKNKIGFMNIEEESLKFYIENQDRINDVIEFKKEIDQFILQKIHLVQHHINKLISPSVKHWIWKDYDLIHDINGRYRVDCFFEPQRISICVYPISELGTIAELESIFGDAKRSEKYENRLEVLSISDKEFKLDYKLVANELLSVINAIISKTSMH